MAQRSVSPAKQWRTVLGALFVLAGSVVAYGDTGYPFLSLAFLAMLGLAVAALVLVLPLAFWPVGRAAIFAIGFTYFLDVAYLRDGIIGKTAIVLLAGYLTYLIAWRKSQTIVPFATTAVAVSVVFILPQQVLNDMRLDPAALTLAKNDTDTGRRPYVHIILDEMSPLGMMPSGPFYDALKRRMIEDYRQRGFDVFDDTVAAAGGTIVSLGQVFATQDGEMHNYTHGDGVFTFSMDENRATERMADAGYALTVLETSYLNICDPERWRCLPYAHSGDGRILSQRVDDPWTAVDYAFRTTSQRLLIDNTPRASVYYQILWRLAGHLGAVTPVWQRDFARPPLTVSLMERAVPALRRLTNGEAVFLHILLPHYPYLLDERCRVKPPGKVLVPRWVTTRIGTEFDATATERAYWEQAACAHGKLMAMIDAILASPGGRDAVILVHGDHGSRLFKLLADPAHETATENERRHTLLAHFAVRGLPEHHEEFASQTRLRDRISIVLDATLGARRPEPGLVTAATR